MAANLDATLKTLTRKLKSARVRVGFLENATYPDGTHVATVAAINNYGAPAAGIPPRPFFTNTVMRGKESWPDCARATLRATGMDANATLTLMGELIAGELREAIVAGGFTANSPVTNLLKQRFPTGDDVTFADVQKARDDVAAGVQASAGKPLVWSGILLNSVDVEVDDHL